MTVKPYAAAAAIVAVLLAGCQQRENAAQTPTAPPVQMSATDGASSGDPSVPPADSTAVARPDQDASAGSARPDDPAPSAQTGRDASGGSALTPQDRDREMPMKGQVNDHSTPDRAKEGDQPNTAAKEPGGQEANPGNVTRNAKETKQ